MNMKWKKQFLLFFRGQVEGEGAAQAGDALQGHVPAVELGDLLHHGQAQPRAEAPVREGSAWKNRCHTFS